MGEEDTVTLNVKGLDQILKALKSNPPVARVGILGSTNSRSSKGSSNATIGAAHEFGTTTIPQRSFLRVPLTENLSKQIESSGALDKNVLADVIKSGTVVPWLKKITVLAEKIVLGAFDSQGYGKWPSWKNPSYSNNTGMVLVDTQQLRNSITSEVKA
jgi:hypothetical protein